MILNVFTSIVVNDPKTAKMTKNDFVICASLFGPGTVSKIEENYNATFGTNGSVHNCSLRVLERILDFVHDLSRNILDNKQFHLISWTQKLRNLTEKLTL